MVAPADRFQLAAGRTIIPPVPYRDITVGALLTRLADDLPGREALVYSHAGERWTFRALDDEARLIARGLVASGVGARRSRGRVGDQRPGMDRPPVRARQDRRDSRHRQHRTARAGNRLPAETERHLDARDDPRVSRRGLSRRAPRRRRDRRRRSPRPRLSEAGAHDLHWRRRPAGSDALRRAARHRGGGAGRAGARARSGGRRRRRHQHAVHVGHDRVPERRDAVEPQHREQRSRAGAGAGLHDRRSPVPVRAALPLLRLRDRRPRRVQPRRLSLSGRVVRPAPRARDRRRASAARRSTACRRCFSRSSKTPSSTAST